jgi:amidohydrolase
LGGVSKAETAKEHARTSIEARRDDLISMSHRIHGSPELAYEEELASTWLAEALAGAAHTVDKPAYDLATAFVARRGGGPLHLAICAEYDALPGVGHACGHNIIASAALGAAIGLAALADDLGLTISVIGTPAEEQGDAGGKIILLERGAFAEIHAAMMVHPFPQDAATPSMIAAAVFDVRYTGKEAHAAAWPWLGINAADALVVAQTSIGLLRQHVLPSDRIHGIVTKGGEAPNIVPAHTAARYMVRSQRIEDLHALRERVLHCFEAGALATGATLEIHGGDKPYAQVEHDGQLADIYVRNATALGRTFEVLEGPSGSTDMGNVSLAVPSIHPFIGIESLPAVNHQPEFAAACVRPPADRAVVDAAIAMAWTAIEIALDDDQRARLIH